MIDSAEKAGAVPPQEVYPQHKDREPQMGKVDPTPKAQAKRGVTFWGIFACLCILAFISALDVVIITRELPTILTGIGVRFSNQGRTLVFEPKLEVYFQ